MAHAPVVDGRVRNGYTDGGAWKMKKVTFQYLLPQKSLMLSGGKQGALWGFGLSSLYFGLILSLSLYDLQVNFPDSVKFDFGSFLLLFLAYLVISTVAMVIGSFTGWVLNTIIETWLTSFSLLKATIFGNFFCSIIVLPLNLSVGQRIFDPSDNAFWTYTLWLTLPSLIYILAGGWVASRFYRIHASI